MKTKAIILLTIAPLCAQVVDQGFDNNVFLGLAGVARDQQPAQTFTVGVEGLLTEVRLDLFKTSANAPRDLYMMITRPNDASYYALEYIEVNNIPVGQHNSAMVSVPLTLPIGLELGEVWSIHLFAHQSGNYEINWTGDPDAPYAGGIAYVRDEMSGKEQPLGVDFSFFTVMSPQDIQPGDPAALGAVPEPSAFAACFGVGLAAFAGWRRLRR